MLRLLHLGDLHLSGAFSGFSARAAAMRRVRQLEALEKMLALATERGVQMILLSGDSFDTETPDPDIVRRFFALLDGCGVPVVIAPGNHDPYRQGGPWDSIPLPRNVFLFRESELAFFSFPSLGVNVYGYAFTESTHAAPALPDRDTLPRDRYNILLAHADMLSSASVYAPLTADELAASGFALAALSHVHNPPTARLFGDTMVAYSGFFAGRGFDECGPGHVNWVEIEGSRVRVTPLETGADRFEICPVDCTGAESGETVRRRASEALAKAAYPDSTALRVELCGEVGAACVPDAMAMARLGTSYALFEVKDRTLPLFDKELLGREPSLRGAFYRAMSRRLEGGEVDRDVAAEALRLGLAALSGRELL